MRPILLKTVVASLIQLVVTGAFGPVQSQVSPGAKIRVTTDSGSRRTQVGTLISADADSLRFTSARDRTQVSIPAGSVVRLEQSRGRRSNAGRGAVIGAAIGGAAGLILGLLASGEEGGWYEVGGEEVALATVFFAGAGAGIGALVGLASHSDRWEPVPVPGRPLEASRTLTRVGVAIKF